MYGKKQVAIASVALLFGIFVGGIIAYGPEIIQKWDTQNRHYELVQMREADALIVANKPREALGVIQQYKEEIDLQSPTGEKWLSLLIDASTQLRDIHQLLVIYDRFPNAFNEKEKASLLVGNGFVLSGRLDEFEQFREKWKGRELIQEEWVVLDADKLLRQGEKEAALLLLESRVFKGKADTPRLVRMALINVDHNPKEAWHSLTEAYKKDPDNPDIRSYRARLLETVGKNSLALSEYVAAVATDPENCYLCDQLAEFYRRQGQYPNALETWKSALENEVTGSIWLKALFWNRVITPIHFRWHQQPPPRGKLHPLNVYLLRLKPGMFWSTAAYNEVPNGKDYLTTEQATFWLRLLDMLQKDQERGAGTLLQFNPFTAISWDPALQLALERIIKFRMKGSLSLDTSSSYVLKEDFGPAPKTLADEKNDGSHFFDQLEFLADIEEKEPGKEQIIPEKIELLIDGKEAFTAAFLAAGWSEAALQLSKLRVIPDEYPDWVAYKMTEALRKNRGNLPALEYALLQKSTPPMELLVGELLIATGNGEKGAEKLIALKNENDEIGYRASWLLSHHLIDQGEFIEARKLLNKHPVLSTDVVGRETLARIAVLEGDDAEANRLYLSLVKESTEAKAYLARKAFAEKKWRRARELTEQLLKEYPDNVQLRENLKKILEEEKNLKVRRRSKSF